MADKILDETWAKLHTEGLTARVAAKRAGAKTSCATRWAKRNGEAWAPDTLMAMRLALMSAPAAAYARGEASPEDFFWVPTWRLLKRSEMSDLESYFAEKGE